MHINLKYELDLANALDDVRHLEPLVKSRQATPRQKHQYWNALALLQSEERKQRAQVEFTGEEPLESEVLNFNVKKDSVAYQVKMMLTCLALASLTVLILVGILALISS